MKNELKEIIQEKCRKFVKYNSFDFNEFENNVLEIFEKIKENEYYKRAMFEESMPLEDMFKCFRKFCKDNGVVYTLYPANRFIEFYQMAIQYKMKFMSLRFVYDKKKKFALRFIVKMKIGPMKDINILKPVYIDAGDVIFDED